MAKRIVETLYGKRCKYEIVRTDHGLGWTTLFYILRDGKEWYSCSTLSHAVDYVRKNGD